MSGPPFEFDLTAAVGSGAMREAAARLPLGTLLGGAAVHAGALAGGPANHAPAA